MRMYNVPKGHTLAPDTGCVQSKPIFASSSRWWPPPSLQSAKIAAGALWAVRGSHLSRLISLPPLCICCATRLPHISTVGEQRLAALRLAQLKVSGAHRQVPGSPGPVTSRFTDHLSSAVNCGPLATLACCAGTRPAPRVRGQTPRSPHRAWSLETLMVVRSTVHAWPIGGGVEKHRA